MSCDLGWLQARIIWNNKDFRGNDYFSTMTLAFWLSMPGMLRPTGR